jgi:ABC-type branched-subunit amino acid transport system ATPase component
MTSKTSSLTATNLSMRFGGVDVFSDISFAVRAGHVTGCIGPNGAGKSTLVNVVCGVYRPVGGQVFLDERLLTGASTVEVVRRGVSRSFQDVRIFPTLTALENVQAAMPTRHGEAVYSFLFGYDASERTNRAVAMGLLDELSLADVAGRTAQDLPFGQQKLIALARTIATGAQFLLLDEPAAGVELDLVPKITTLVQRLATQEQRGILLIEHNVDVIRAVAEDAFVLQGGRVIAQGKCQQVLNDERVIKEYLGRIYDA